MYLTSLKLKNIRNLSDQTIRFQCPATGPTPAQCRGLTVFVGENGAGKTSVLQAAILGVLGHLASAPSDFDLLRPGTRDGKLTAELVKPAGEVVCKSADLTRVENGRGSFRTRYLESPPRWIGSWTPINETADTFAGPPPFVCGYGATRLTGALEDERQGILHPRSAEAAAGLLRGLTHLRSPIVDLPGTDTPKPLFYDSKDLTVLATRRKEIAGVISQLLERNISLEIEDEKRGSWRLVDPASTTVSIDTSPSGFRSVVSWTADLLTRLALHLGGSSIPLADSSGIVFIDEVALHLHPRWQVDFLHRLTAALPKLQWIITTHSPLVVASARGSEIRVLSLDEANVGYISDQAGEPPGRVDEILLGPWFKMQNVRPPEQAARLADFAEKAAKGDKDAADGFLAELLTDQS